MVLLRTTAGIALGDWQRVATTRISSTQFSAWRQQQRRTGELSLVETSMRSRSSIRRQMVEMDGSFHQNHKTEPTVSLSAMSGDRSAAGLRSGFKARSILMMAVFNGESSFVALPRCVDDGAKYFVGSTNYR